MPRRPPKKPNPSLNLSGHLLSLESLPVPLDPAILFPRQANVELEIGCGKGLFLSTASTAVPERNFLGAEIVVGYARLCAGKLAQSQSTNARIIHGDALFLVRSMLCDACLVGIHVYFPDPWWKARHRKRRVLSEAFLDHAGRVLRMGGQLHIWTDVEDYFQESILAVAATGLFSKPRDEPPSPASHDLDYRTHFDRRTRLAGEPVWRAVLDRNQAPPRGPREHHPQSSSSTDSRATSADRFD
ncbi:MAG: tRNA (guanosine(46)-N7)-methyltransferase TrmB [Planctomycetia bacterium]|nr:tRNA (guanosine(46)-N7)-methyltransferase TrmB [Planctomycetia bacterium]